MKSHFFKELWVPYITNFEFFVEGVGRGTLAQKNVPFPSFYIFCDIFNLDYLVVELVKKIIRNE